MAAKPNSQIFIITVTGIDKVGIIGKLATSMANANVNIIDVNQRIMDKFFVMTMAVDVAEATVNMDSLKKRLDRIAKNLMLNITIQDEHIFEAMHRI